MRIAISESQVESTPGPGDCVRVLGPCGAWASRRNTASEMAAPAPGRTPSCTGLTKRSPSECEWKRGARLDHRRPTQAPPHRLTSTGLLMEVRCMPGLDRSWAWAEEAKAAPALGGRQLRDPSAEAGRGASRSESRRGRTEAAGQACCGQTKALGKVRGAKCRWVPSPAGK